MGTKGSQRQHQHSSHSSTTSSFSKNRNHWPHPRMGKAERSEFTPKCHFICFLSGDTHFPLRERGITAFQPQLLESVGGELVVGGRGLCAQPRKTLPDCPHYLIPGLCLSRGFTSGSDGKESACNAGDLGSSPGEGNGYPLQYSCLENPMDRGVWWATVHGVAKSRTELSN